MEDEKYCFIEDVKERKEIARSAKHKKNGSKSKKVTFPSDYLTKKEREKMNGECKTWQMNGFYSYSEFKQMPDDIKVVYLTTLIKKYYLSVHSIERYVFKIGPSTLDAYLRSHNLRKLIPNRRKEGPMYCDKADIKRLKADMDAWYNPAPPADIFVPSGMAPGYCTDGTPVEESIKELEESKAADIPDTPIQGGEEPEPETEALSALNKGRAKIGYMEFSMDRFDADIFNKLSRMFNGDEVTINIRINRHTYPDCLATTSNRNC